MPVLVLVLLELLRGDLQLQFPELFARLEELLAQLLLLLLRAQDLDGLLLVLLLRGVLVLLVDFTRDTLRFFVRGDEFGDLDQRKE